MMHTCMMYPCPFCHPRCPTCGGYVQHWHQRPWPWRWTPPRRDPPPFADVNTAVRQARDIVGGQ